MRVVGVEAGNGRRAVSGGRGKGGCKDEGLGPGVGVQGQGWHSEKDKIKQSTSELDAVICESLPVLAPIMLPRVQPKLHGEARKPL